MSNKLTEDTLKSLQEKVKAFRDYRRSLLCDILDYDCDHDRSIISTITSAMDNECYECYDVLDDYTDKCDKHKSPLYSSYEELKELDLDECYCKNCISEDNNNDLCCCDECGGKK